MKNKNKKAFTLIELLVVIAIIALLLAVLMPALKKAKLIAKTVVCVTNCKTLSTAWNMYASENHQKIVSSKTGFGRFGERYPYNPPLFCENPWVDWAGYPNYNDPADKKRQTEAVERGVLYPYVESLEAYRCSLSKKDQVRCYAIPDVLGRNAPKEIGGDHVVYKITDMKLPSERVVFLDEDEISYGGFTIYIDRPSWWDYPPSRHNDGVTLGYADGHAEYYKWRDKQTMDLCKKIRENRGSVSTADLNQPGNEDLIRMQRANFGTLEYIP